jgi:eukaryotic-like serine/threonine-protein kinase
MEHNNPDNPAETKPILGNRYQLESSLGSGGMAVVYQAHDMMLERQVAIKLLRQRFSRDPAFRDRFHQEAKAAANLSHSNVVTVYDFGLEDNRLYIVMEYVPGTNLKDMIKERGRFSIDDTINLVSQACFGIGYAHRSGLVHCDVKPHNMLVTPSNRVKVTDFGIARVMATILPDEHHDIIWGSPLYFAPEQAAGEAPLPASDVYSLGIILYEMLTGELPFKSEDPVELIYLHRETEPVPPRKLNPIIPPVLEQIIMKVLSKKPSARYRTADQLGRVLKNLNRIANDKQKEEINTPLRTVRPRSPGAVISAASATTSEPVEKKDILDFDWITLSMGLLTAIAVSGLIPFWLFVWFSLKTP